MSARHNNEDFVLVRDMNYDGEGLSLGLYEKDDGIFWFGDGDGYSPLNLEVSFGPDVQYIGWVALERLINSQIAKKAI